MSNNQMFLPFALEDQQFLAVPFVQVHPTQNDKCHNCKTTSWKRPSYIERSIFIPCFHWNHSFLVLLYRLLEDQQAIRSKPVHIVKQFNDVSYTRFSRTNWFIQTHWASFPTPSFRDVWRALLKNKGGQMMFELPLLFFFLELFTSFFNK